MKDQKIIFIVLGAVAVTWLGIFIYSSKKNKKGNPPINLNDKNSLIDYLWKNQPNTGGAPTMPKSYFENLNIMQLWTMIKNRYPNIILPYE